MTDITPSDTQHRAITAIRDWFQFGTKNQQVFRLFGFAGTGKSTVLKFALQELCLDPHRSGSEGVPCVPGVPSLFKINSFNRLDGNRAGNALGTPRLAVIR